MLLLLIKIRDFEKNESPFHFAKCRAYRIEDDGTVEFENTAIVPRREYIELQYGIMLRFGIKNPCIAEIADEGKNIGYYPNAKWLRWVAEVLRKNIMASLTDVPKSALPECKRAYLIKRSLYLAIESICRKLLGLNDGESGLKFDSLSIFDDMLADVVAADECVFDRE